MNWLEAVSSTMGVVWGDSESAAAVHVAAATYASTSDHWNELHRYVFTTPESCEAFYIDWTIRIPNLGCDCMAHWSELTSIKPPDFSSSKAFFEWGWARHNDVNQRLHAVDGNHLPFSLDDAYAMHYPAVWVDVQEDEHPITSDRLVITLATGDYYQSILDVSRPTIRAYAQKIGADYIELTNKTQTWWGLEKFRVGHFSKQYDRTLYIDADCLVKPGTPDLFEVVSPDRIGFHNDNPYNPGGSELWLTSERSALLNSQGVSLRDYGEPVCQNTGVIVMSRHHDIWKGMQKPFPKKHCDEQFWIEYQAQQYPIQQLSYRFNNQYWFGDRFWNQCPGSYIIHFAACPRDNRLELMRKEISSW
jgi:hypothetical protein